MCMVLALKMLTILFWLCVYLVFSIPLSKTLELWNYVSVPL